MKTTRFVFLAICFLISGMLRAQIIWDFPQTIAVGDPSVLTTITLRTVKLEYRAPVTLPPVYVQPGSSVRLQLGDWAASGTQFIWHKSGVVGPLAATGPVLELKNVQETDMGSYSCSVTTPSGASTYPVTDPTKAALQSETITLRMSVVPRDDIFTALSTLVRITREQPTVVIGFVVTRQTQGYRSRMNEVLIRAVGPSLNKYGVSDPLARPKLRIYKADGTETIFNGIVRIPESTVTWIHYRRALA